MTPDILKRMADAARARVEEEKRVLSHGKLLELAAAARTPYDFRAAFLPDGARVIAEIKLASPSRGDIAPGADPVSTARSYLSAGAAAVSVLTEPDFFKGSSAYLRRVREACPDARLLMKDFFVDEYQIAKARADGADCVLLMLSVLGGERTALFMRKARELGLSCLVEVHDERELEAAAEAGADLIGVNNRDLRTLKTDPGVSLRLAARAPKHAVLISESGLDSGRDISVLRAAGYRGFLVGTSLMRERDPGAALRRLLEEARA
ncbi:MAG TPA: indole-3-glycerol phosphate synthase TrpC [Elusimicrobiales bacterium]|nr:indole-3-glycerol phosphate synthase TrpC [Elusimicrobiales bacterium]